MNQGDALLDFSLTFQYPARFNHSLVKVEEVRCNGNPRKRVYMITLGIVLLIISMVVTGAAVLKTLGLILIIIGVVLFLLGGTSRAIGGRRHYW